MENQKSPNDKISPPATSHVTKIDPTLVYPSQVPSDQPDTSAYKRAGFLTFKKVFLAAFLFFVVLPVIAALMAGSEGGWGTVAIIVDVIFAIIVLGSVWAIHFFWQRNKSTGVTLNKEAADAIAPNAVSPKDPVDILSRIGLILLFISAAGTIGLIVLHNSNSSGSLPVWYPIFYLFVAPAINLLGIGCFIWGMVSLSKSAHRKKLAFAALLCLSPIALAAAASYYETRLLSSSDKAQLEKLKSIPITIYAPPYSEGYSIQSNFGGLGPDPPHIENRHGITAVQFRIYKKGGLNAVYVYMLQDSPDYLPTSKTFGTCGPSESTLSSPCHYAFTTNDGTVVYTHTGPTDEFSNTTITYFFKKGSTYMSFMDSDYDKHNIDPQQFINSLQPVTVEDLETNYIK